jgi:hypothetical protein
MFGTLSKVALIVRNEFYFFQKYTNYLSLFVEYDFVRFFQCCKG